MLYINELNPAATSTTVSPHTTSCPDLQQQRQQVLQTKNFCLYSFDQIKKNFEKSLKRKSDIKNIVDKHMETRKESQSKSSYLGTNTLEVSRH